MGFLSTLLYILLGFYALKFLLRLFAPKIMAFALKMLQKKMSDSFSNASNFNTYGNRSTTASDKKTTVSKKKDPVGEYIDFEEIE